MRTKLFSKLATVWLFVFLSLVLNIATACGHDPEHYNETVQRVNQSKECPINVLCKSKGN